MNKTKPQPGNTGGVAPATTTTVLNRLSLAGFTLDTDGQRLKVAPALLSATQRDWLAAHKAALVAALATPHWRWCVEYPRTATTPHSGSRCVVDCLPERDWRTVSADYRGAAVWPAPDGLDAADWIQDTTTTETQHAIID